MKNNLYLYIVLIFVLSAVLTTITYKEVIISYSSDPENTVVVSGDLATGASPIIFFDEYLSEWNSHYSRRNSIEFLRSVYYFFQTPLFYSQFPASFFVVNVYILHFISALAFFLLGYYYFKKSVDKQDRKSIFLFILIILSLIYSFNPYVFVRNHHMSIRVAYTFFPLLMLSYISILDKKKNWAYVFLFTYCLLIMFSVPHYVIFSSLFLIIYSLWYSYRKSFKTLFKQILKISPVVILICLPFVLIILNSVGNGFVTPAYISSLDNINLISRNSGVLSTLTLRSFWNLQASEVGFFNLINSGALLLTMIFLMISLKYRNVLFLVLILLLILINSYDLILMKHFLGIVTMLFPVFSSIFRDPSKFINLYLFFLLLFSFLLILKCQSPNKLRIFFLLFLISFMLINYDYIFSLKANQDIHPEIIPEKIEFISSFNKYSSEEIGKVLVIPEYWSKKSYWNQNAAGTFTSRSINVSTFDFSSGLFKYSYLKYFSPYYDRALICNKNYTTDAFYLLDELGIKYVYIQRDILNIPEDDLTCVLESFNESIMFELVNKTNTDYIFEVKNFSFGNIHNMFQYREDFATGIKNLDKSTFFIVPKNNCDVDKNESSSVFNTFYYLNSTNKINLVTKTNRYSPTITWSKAFWYDPLHGEISPYLKNVGTFSSFNDFGEGVVFTQAPNAKLSFDLTSWITTKIKLKYLSHSGGGSIEVCVNSECQVVNTKSNNNALSWAELNLTTEKGKNPITIQNIVGLNVVSTMVFDNYTFEEISQIMFDQNCTKFNSATNAQQAVINSVERCGDDCYLYNVTSIGPFYITFPEKFDINWVLDFNGTKIKPEMAMGMINCFFVPHSGNLVFKIYQNKINFSSIFFICVALTAVYVGVFSIVQKFKK